MKRREFIAFIGGAAGAWPLAARAQQPGRTYRLGFLIPSGRETPGVLAFFDELRLNGFIEGQNVTVIPGGFDVSFDQLDERAAAVVKAAHSGLMIACGTFSTDPALRDLGPFFGALQTWIGHGASAVRDANDREAT